MASTRNRTAWSWLPSELARDAAARRAIFAAPPAAGRDRPVPRDTPRGSATRAPRPARPHQVTRRTGPQQGGATVGRAGKGAVGDLADERLDERHLAALGRPRVDVLDEEFPPRERPAQVLHGARSCPLAAAEPIDSEALPEDGRILDQAPFGGGSASSRAAIRACSVSGTEGSSGRPTGRSRRRPAPGGPRPPASGSSRPHRAGSRRLVRRSPGAAHRETRNELGEQLDDRGLRQRLEAERHEVAPAGTPVRSMLEQLGRATVMIRIGTPRLHSTRSSMKSSVPGSAQCRSSKTRATVPSAAIRSKNVRHAENSSSRAIWVAVSTPSRTRSADSIQRRSDRRHPSFDGLGDLHARRRSSSVSASPARVRTISPSAQNVMP